MQQIYTKNGVYNSTSWLCLIKHMRQVKDYRRSKQLYEWEHRQDHYLSKIGKEFFIEKAHDLSITTGVIKRKRKITGSAFVRTLILGNMADGNCSMEGMCQLLWEDAIDITKQGLDFRFTENAVKFMQAMYQECIHLFKKALQLDCQVLEQFNSLKLLDSSQVNLPNHMEDMYKGCGASYKGRNPSLQ